MKIYDVEDVEPCVDSAHRRPLPFSDLALNCFQFCSSTFNNTATG